jgi:hypothetical protein
MEKKQTVVEWLAEQRLQGANLDNALEQAKQMEKEQIMDAYEQGDKYKLNFSGEQFYNETYGGNNEQHYILYK